MAKNNVELAKQWHNNQNVKTKLLNWWKFGQIAEKAAKNNATNVETLS